MAEGVLAEGTLYVDLLVAGVAQGLEKWEGIAKLEIKPNSELKEATSKDKDKYGQIVASVAINKPAELSLILKNINRTALAMALQGSGSAMSQGSGTVTAQACVAKVGKFLELGKRNIASAGFTLTNSAATTTYVLGTDYEVNYATGFVGIIATGAITEAQSLKANYAYSAVAGDKIMGATVPQVKGRLILDGRNLVDGKPMIITIWEATLTAEGAVDFMADDLIQLSMKGRMATPTGKASPVEIEFGMVFS